MALMLRKACQVVLDNAGLTQFYADINPNSKGLVIHNICGRPFTSVHGVTFSRNDVNKDEIVFAVELLTKWLERNGVKVADYLKAKAALEASTEPPTKFKIKDWSAEISISVESNYGDSSRGKYTYTVRSSLTKDKLTYCFNTAMDLIGVTCSKPVPIWNGQLKVPTAIFESLWKSVNVTIAYYHNKKIVEDTQASLNSCCAT